MTGLLLWAQDFTPKAGAGDPPAFWSFGGPGFMMALMGLAMVFLMVLPARRQKKEQQRMLAALKPGVKVVTSSGIVGTLVKVKDTEDEVTIRSEDTKLRVLKSTVTRVLGDESTETK
jgi:preprotein translocase subunit YajC